MKIALLHPSLKPPRGAERQVCNLAYNLQKMGHEVTFYVFNKEINPIYNDLLKDIKLEIIPLTGDDERFLLHKMKQISNDFKKFDVINPHNQNSHWIAGFVNKPVVWMCNEPPIWNYFSWTEEEKLQIYDKYIFDRLIVEKTKSIAALDEDMKEILEKSYPQNKVMISYSGVDIKRKIKKKKHKDFNILMVGALHPQRRPTDILFAANKIRKLIPNMKFHFVGVDYMKDNVSILGHSLGLDVIQHSGIDDEELYKLFEITDVGMLVSARQPWGIFPLETLMLGIPTIVSDEVGMRNFIPSDCISVSKMGDIDDLAEKLLDVYKNHDVYKRKIVERRLSEMLTKKFSWENYAKRMYMFFEEVLNDAP